MLHRHLILGVAIGAGLAGCREQAGDPPQSGPAAEEPAEAWMPLTGQWHGVEGAEVTETDGILRLEAGYSLTGARWHGEIPKVPFELEAEARRVMGSDFFFSVTFPGRTDAEAATLVVGGWGGGLVGISSIDGLDASENETAEFMNLEDGRWYAIRLRVSASRIEAWIDGEPVIDVPVEDRKLSLRPGPIEVCAPFGVATWETVGEMRNMRWKPLPEPLQP